MLPQWKKRVSISLITGVYGRGYGFWHHMVFLIEDQRGIFCFLIFNFTWGDQCLPLLRPILM